MKEYAGNVLGQDAYTWIRRGCGCTWVDTGLALEAGPKLNNNLIVVGAPGSGKSRSVVEPNVMQLSSSYVIVDPKGSLRAHLAPGLSAAGYRIRTLDLANPRNSDCTWNPLSAVRTVADAEALAGTIVTSCGRNSRDPFWDSSSKVHLASLILATSEIEGCTHDLAGVLDLESKSYMEPVGNGSEIHVPAYREAPFAAPMSPTKVGRDKSELGRLMAGLGTDPEEVHAITREYVKARASHSKACSEVLIAKDRLRDAALGENNGSRGDTDYLATMLINKARQHAVLADGSLPSTGEATRKAFISLVQAYRDREDSRGALERASERRPHKRGSEALELYERVANSASETWESIRVTTASIIDQWRDPELLAALSDGPDALDPRSLGRDRSALFVVVSDVDDSLYPLAGMLVSQIVEELVRYADSTPEGCLPVPVRLILDDYATMRGGSWAAVDRWANATRSRDVWWTVVVQGLAQLDGMLGSARARSLVTACDQQVFVGAPNDLQTARHISALTGESVRNVLASGTGTEVVVLRGLGARRVEVFDPDLHPNRVEFEFERMALRNVAEGGEAFH